MGLITFFVTMIAVLILYFEINLNNAFSKKFKSY